MVVLSSSHLYFLGLIPLQWALFPRDHGGRALALFSTFTVISFFPTSSFSLHPLKSVKTPKNMYDLGDVCWGSSHISSLPKALCPKAEHHYKLSNQLIKCYFIFVSMHWFPSWCDSPISHSLSAAVFYLMLTFSHSVFSVHTFLSTKCALAMGLASW